jgi:hypothetical protein
VRRGLSPAPHAFHREISAKTNRAAPLLVAPTAAPFLPPVSAPINVPTPAVPANHNASRFHDRLPPTPHVTTFITLFIFYHPRRKNFRLQSCTPVTEHKYR